MIFSREPEDYQKTIDDYTARLNAIGPRLDRAMQVRRLFDEFPAWDRFREQYLKGVRLAQLHAAAAVSLTASDEQRTLVRGQIEELNILCQSREELDKLIQHMVDERSDMENRRQKAAVKLERKRAK